jgi:hypothetical protein
MAKTAFTEADVRRAIKGAIDGGLQVGSVEVLRDGTIRILPTITVPKQTPLPKPKDWD